jgi:hypothetical protein
MFTYLAVMVSRVFSGTSDYSILDMINPICSSLIWGALVFFVFEMRYIQDLLQSKDRKEFHSHIVVRKRY